MCLGHTFRREVGLGLGLVWPVNCQTTKLYKCISDLIWRKRGKGKEGRGQEYSYIHGFGVQSVENTYSSTRMPSTHRVAVKPNNYALY